MKLKQGLAGIAIKIMLPFTDARRLHVNVDFYRLVYVPSLTKRFTAEQIQ